MRSSYREEDVTLLLKDITGLVEPQSTEEREKQIQAGRHYCEMLPIEYVPTAKYMQVYEEALQHFSKPVAEAVGVLADRIMQQRGEGTVIVSLARAGIPVGILVRHFLQFKYKIDVPHYSISIIRGRGIDRNAMRYLLDRYQPEQLLFLDGWIGKGAIYQELKKELAAYPGVSSDIAVIADPANITGLCGTHEDILIPSSCLNSTVSGLISRTLLRDDIIGPEDFHGAVFYEELRDADLSYAFIEAIEQHFSPENENTAGVAVPPCTDPEPEELIESQDLGEVKQIDSPGIGEVKQIDSPGLEEVRGIGAKFGIRDVNLVKPGIGETTRVLLRRVPWKVLVDPRYEKSPELAHVVRLAEEKMVPVEFYPLRNYKCCGIIKKLADT
ncbi:MAG: cysteine protease StiP family protein [Lachnospiraceae bacterium]|nr:cysteine protease StiP family protein [Lachnospiraceae bacterium]